MRPDFSEFSYGFALTHEIVNQLHVRSAPVLPSLIEEGSSSGFDVGIDTYGVAIFLQFKLSNFLTRTFAKQWKHFNQPYYRFDLMPRSYSRQHEMLVNLEARGNQVFYAAPTFHTQASFNQLFLNQAVCHTSVFIRPSDIGMLPDDNQHSVSFIPNSLWALFCSEPQEIPINTGEGLQEVIDKMEYRTLDYEYYSSLAATLLELVKDKNLRMLLKASVYNSDTPKLSVQNIARIAYSCELITLTAKDKNLNDRSNDFLNK